jgi:mono/diheme cytochrome c family protein
MKKILLIGLLVIAVLLFTNFVQVKFQTEISTDDAIKFEIPANVQAVIDNSCYACHNSESSNEDAKEELAFDQLNMLKKYKLVGLLKDIEKEVSEAEMPPKKFLKKYPDHALSENDKEILLTWAHETAKKIAGN